MTKVAVCITTYNSGQFLKQGIESILDQTHKNFRLIIVDDGSTDNTQAIIKEFKDKRINYKKNPKNLGIAASRNECIKQLSGEKYVFFTDADCHVDSDWIENGLKFFKSDKKIICVNGKTAYVHDGYRPHMFEKSNIQTDDWEAAYQTCNIAYKTDVLKKVGGFDDKNLNNMMEDTDLALRVKEQFPDMKFISTDKMRVTHQKVEWIVTSFFKDTKKVVSLVKFLKKHGKNNKMVPAAYRGHILNKNYLALSIFPPGIVYYIFKTKKRVSCWRDILFVFLYLLKSYYYRCLVWKHAINNRIFLV